MANKFGFIILHYCALEATIKCVESVIKNIDTDNYEIIIVDNASPNNTGLDLEKKYSNRDRVSVILNESNSGYSSGNNVGIKYAIDRLNCNFIVIMNNDTQIIQEDFTAVIENEYNKSKFAAMGPQVFDLQGYNDSNPLQGNPPLTVGAAKDCCAMWRKQYIKSVLKLDDFHPRSHNGDNEIVKEEHIPETNRLEDVILHGCCVVLSPVYLEKFNGIPEISFMYSEEPALLYRLRKNHMLSVYNPKLKIFHEEAISTKHLKRNMKTRNKMMYDAAKGLLKFYKENQ